MHDEVDVSAMRFDIVMQSRNIMEFSIKFIRSDEDEDFFGKKNRFHDKKCISEWS